MGIYRDPYEIILARMGAQISNNLSHLWKAQVLSATQKIELRC